MGEIPSQVVKPTSQKHLFQARHFAFDRYEEGIPVWGFVCVCIGQHVEIAHSQFREDVLVTQEKAFEFLQSRLDSFQGERAQVWEVKLANDVGEVDGTKLRAAKLWHVDGQCLQVCRMSDEVRGVDRVHLVELCVIDAGTHLNGIAINDLNVVGIA